MADLVSTAAIAGHLGLEGDEVDGALAVLLDQVEAEFEAACGRADRPFQPAQPTRTEYHDGTGGRELFLDYPVAALTSIKLGYDPAAPDETLDVADKLVVGFAVGRCRVVRRDGGLFGERGQAGYVQVVYDAAADLPEDAARAILRATAKLWLQRGSEDVTAESIGGYRGELAVGLDSDPDWGAAVKRHRVVQL